jgi:hypothetical protein
MPQPPDARTQHLQPYQFKPGQSGNPSGFSRSRREQLEACEQAARAHTEEAIATLVELMRHSEDGRVRVVAEKGCFVPAPLRLVLLPHLPSRSEEIPLAILGFGPRELARRPLRLVVTPGSFGASLEGASFGLG